MGPGDTDPLDRLAGELGRELAEYEAGRGLEPLLDAQRAHTRSSSEAERRAAARTLLRLRHTVAAVPDRLQASAERLVQLGFDRVFDEPRPIRTVDECVAALMERSEERDLPGMVRKLASLPGTVMVGRIGRLGRYVPSGRALTVLLGAAQIAAEARRGVHDLQVLASFLTYRAHEAGVVLDRPTAERAVLSAYLAPGRAPAPRRPAITKLIAHWAAEAVRPRSERSARARARKRADTIARLTLGALPPPPGRLPLGY